jgi:hypothetical protein
MQISSSLAGAGRHQQCKSVPNGDTHCRDNRTGQAGLNRVRRGKNHHTGDIRKCDKQGFRPALAREKPGRQGKQPDDVIMGDSEIPSCGNEAQCRQDKQTHQNCSAPTKHIAVQEMRGNACTNGDRPKHGNCHRLAAQFREHKKPKPAHRSQHKQATKAELMRDAMWFCGEIHPF